MIDLVVDIVSENFPLIGLAASLGAIAFYVLGRTFDSGSWTLGQGLLDAVLSFAATPALIAGLLVRTEEQWPNTIYAEGFQTDMWSQFQWELGAFYQRLMDMAVGFPGTVSLQMSETSVGNGILLAGIGLVATLTVSMTWQALFNR